MQNGKFRNPISERNEGFVEEPKYQKIKSFYESGSENIKKDLFENIAQNISNTFYSPSNAKKGVSITQLRRIYDTVKKFEQKLSSGQSVWEKELPYIKMLKSKMRYLVDRSKKIHGNQNTIFYNNLSDFIFECVDLIDSQENFFIFCALFEAVYGFYYEHRPDKKNN